MKKLNIVLAFLTLHLLGVHVKLLYAMNPDFEGIKKTFSFASWNEITILAALFGISYSVMTVFAISIFSSANKRKWVLVWFAILDAIGVLIYYNAAITGTEFIWFSSIYYAAYTFSIIACVAIIPHNEGINNLTHKRMKTPTSISIPSDMDDETEKKGTHFQQKKADEEQKIIDYKIAHPTAKGKEIAKELKVSEAKVCRTLKLIK